MSKQAKNGQSRQLPQNSNYLKDEAVLMFWKFVSMKVSRREGNLVMCNLVNVEHERLTERQIIKGKKNFAHVFIKIVSE